MKYISLLLVVCLALICSILSPISFAQNNSTELNDSQNLIREPLFGALESILDFLISNSKVSTVSQTLTELPPLEKPNLESYGLPPADSANVAALVNQLQSEPARSASLRMLQGEKLAIQKGIAVKPYLTSAWLWFENGKSGYPDVYSINCDDTPSLSVVTNTCSSSNFQVAGYQAAARREDYARFYNQLYTPEDFQTVVESVISNSNTALREGWRYTANLNQLPITTLAPHGNVPEDISSETLSAASSSFTNEKTQFYTLLAGKDPAMAAALNSVAVSDSDLVSGLKTQECLYGYICAQEKQLLADMTEALYMFDSENYTTQAANGEVSAIVSWAQTIAQRLEIGEVWNYYNKLTNPPSANGYTATYREGKNTGVDKSSIYWCTNLVIDAYNLSNISGLDHTHQGVAAMKAYFGQAANLRLVDLSGQITPELASQVKPGCVYFMEKVRGEHTGDEHVGIVTSLSVDGNGNGVLETLDANTSTITHKFPIVNGQVQNTWQPVTGFGCPK